MALRLVAAEAILAYLNSATFSDSNIAMDTRARLIEDVIVPRMRGRRRVNPVGRLLNSGIQAHPPSSKLLRDIPAVTPTDVSKQAQGTPSVPGTSSMQSRNLRRDRDISHGEGPHVRGTRVAPIQAADGKTIGKTRPPSGYPVRRATSSRIPQIRSHAPPSAEVEVQMSWQKDVASRLSKEAMGQREPVLAGGP
ncbi:hypothetical protein AZE42_12327, partial [Rhizopogon vesiculosus]